MIWYKFIFLKFYHSLSPLLGLESTDRRPTLSKWLLLLWYKGYQKLHNGVGFHCPAQPSPSMEFKPRTFESHCANIPIWKTKKYNIWKVRILLWPSHLESTLQVFLIVSIGVSPLPSKAPPHFSCQPHLKSTNCPSPPF